MLLFFAAVAFALCVSFVCSLFEATLLSLTPSQVADLSMRHPKIGARWQTFKNAIAKPIAAILILNTAAHTVGATVAGAQFEGLFGKEWLLAFSLAFTYLMLQLTEILPKTLGVMYNRRLAFYMAMPLEMLARAMTPIIYLVHTVNRIFEGRHPPAEGPRTLEEISALAGMARLSNLIGKHEERIIREASRLSETYVKEVMIPMEQVTMLSTSQTITDAILTAHLDPHTRFPICEGDNRGNVLGYVNFKEIIYRVRTNPGDPSLRGIIRPVHFVGPEESSAALLRVFIEQHVHMAIVVQDDQALGLVTLEDIVEELVGELDDEFDRLPRMCHALSGGTWMVGGGFPAAQLRSIIGAELPHAHGSLSAWLIERIGKLPNRNSIHKEGDVAFMIRRIRRGKIFEVAVSTGGVPLPLP
ncbi:MAG TPA: hemolysin family protein [Candidatus Hydrogenedentes bacterium]|nr:hemolysin family protein [Candidatus Hydrogenedentota bacterium]